MLFPRNSEIVSISFLKLQPDEYKSQLSGKSALLPFLAGMNNLTENVILVFFSWDALFSSNSEFCDFQTHCLIWNARYFLPRYKRTRSDF